ncbi:hypothetical protein [Staphylococcus aureus]|uniref:hypothetical protein n=1 Tax=Staphylococcus aureus TaxID=1280 RepID=UPI001642BA59|nr:hypothetical protein [Staphylococcus aureus]
MLNKMEGVENGRVNLRREEGKVEYYGEERDGDKVVSGIEKLGYEGCIKDKNKDER